MVISAYQVSNVLRVYGEQLRQERISNRNRSDVERSPDRISISPGAKRRATIDRIASTIIDRITQYGPHDHVEKEIFKKLEDEYGANLTVSPKSPSEFCFKVIDDQGETLHALSIEDSRFLKHKLKEITQETVENNMF
jgi:hypothetical protein